MKTNFWKSLFYKQSYGNVRKTSDAYNQSSNSLVIHWFQTNKKIIRQEKKWSSEVLVAEKFFPSFFSREKIYRRHKRNCIRRITAQITLNFFH